MKPDTALARIDIFGQLMSPRERREHEDAARTYRGIRIYRVDDFWFWRDGDAAHAGPFHTARICCQSINEWLGDEEEDCVS